MTIFCDSCEGLIGRNPDCEACVSSGRRVALAGEFITPGSKTMFAARVMQAWRDQGGEVVFIDLEASPRFLDLSDA